MVLEEDEVASVVGIVALEVTEVALAAVVVVEALVEIEEAVVDLAAVDVVATVVVTVEDLVGVAAVVEETLGGESAITRLC